MSFSKTFFVAARAKIYTPFKKKVDRPENKKSQLANDSYQKILHLNGYVLVGCNTCLDLDRVHENLDSCKFKNSNLLADIPKSASADMTVSKNHVYSYD